MMRFNQLGHTGVFVSNICFGAMTFGGAGTLFGVIGGLDQASADKLVGDALEAGVNFFDTANVYGVGDSETMLARALGDRRKDVVIATKVCGRMSPLPNDTGLSRLHIIAQCESSLKRLNTDYIDLYQIHRYDPLTPLEETLGALDDLVRQGKVRYIGCSNLTAWQVMKALGISERKGLEKFVTVQAYYSLAGRDIEREIVPLLKDQNIGLLPWSPLAGGFLTGKFTRTSTDEHARRSKFDFPPIDRERAYAVIDAIEDIRGAYPASVAQIALAWLLHQSSVTSVIIGVKTRNQLADNLGAAEIQLTDADLERLDAVSALPAEYPGWMFEALGSDRRPGEVRDLSKVMKS